MKTIAVLIASAPNGPNAGRAWALAHLLEQQGHCVLVCLWQDGVLGAVAGREGNAIPGEVWVLDEDLTLRGFGPDDLVPGARPIGYGELVDLWMERCDSVLGAF